MTVSKDLSNVGQSLPEYGSTSWQSHLDARHRVNLKSPLIFLKWDVHTVYRVPCPASVMSGRPGFDPPQRQRTFLLASVSRPALRSTQLLVQWVSGVLTPGLKRCGFVTLSIESYFSSPLGVCMAEEGQIYFTLIFTFFPANNWYAWSNFSYACISCCHLRNPHFLLALLHFVCCQINLNNEFNFCLINLLSF
jgi:hypothetical protein